jgi:hypothetical protein
MLLRCVSCNACHECNAGPGRAAWVVGMELAKRDGWHPRKLSAFLGYLILYENTAYCREAGVARVPAVLAREDRRTVCQVMQKFYSPYLKLGI